MTTLADTSTPLVSVVIPTTGSRPDLLRRAIDSCFGDIPAGSVEVLVVFNGEGPRDDLPTPVPGRPVRFLHVPVRHANTARNVGLAAATGTCVRFLDDDDRLDPVGAPAQYRAMQAAGADACSGAFRFEDADGRELGHYAPLPGDDFVAELFLQRASTVPVAHLFRRDFLAGMQWDPARPYLQDVDWMYALLRRGEIAWLPFRDPVGAWCRHGGERTSVAFAGRSPHAALKMAADILLASIDALEGAGRLQGRRRAAAAKALWDYAHQGFRHSPRYWHRVAVRARRLDPASRPGAAYFGAVPLRWCNPLLVEWVLCPLRAAMRGMVR